MNYYIIAIIIIAVIATVLILAFQYNEPYDRKQIKLHHLPTIPARQTYNKHKVLIFNSFAYDNKLPEYAKYSSIITKAYADKYGYDYKQFNHKSDVMPPYWLRVKDTYDILMSGEYDIVMYLDLDATIYDFELPISDVISDERYDFFVGSDVAQLIERSDFNNLLNTGCFIVRNTDWSRQFVKTWMDGCIDTSGKLSGI